ncbi:MAG: histone deacetylase [Spirochaetales bacterium]|nr:histone deacetylase [Spirochaetales bacterium]
MVKKTGYIYSDVFLSHKLHPRLPETPHRLEAIKKRIAATELNKKLHHIKISKRTQTVKNAILMIHSATHYNSVTKWADKAHPALEAVAGVLSAVDAVMKNRVVNSFCAIRPPGHHAHNNGAHCDGNYQGEGFCFFNNVAIAARYAQKTYGCKNILILDWDYHHGNGTEWAFYRDPSVFFFSTHALYDYPVSGFPQRIGEGKGKGYNCNVPLPDSATDKDIIHAFRQKLTSALAKKKFIPELIFISAGFDSRKDDPIGTFQITDKGFADLTRFVMTLAEQCCHGKIVSVLEGGYNPLGLSQAVTAHIRTLMNGTQYD